VTKNLCVGPALIVFAVNECGAPKLGWIRQKSQREELFVPAVVLQMPKYQIFRFRGSYVHIHICQCSPCLVRVGIFHGVGVGIRYMAHGKASRPGMERAGRVMPLQLLLGKKKTLPVTCLRLSRCDPINARHVAVKTKHLARRINVLLAPMIESVGDDVGEEKF
jgi:hypothetical protein